jgi:hypothetical protein
MYSSIPELQTHHPKTFEFGSNYDFDIPSPQLPSIEFKVYDSDTFGSEPLGFVTLPLEYFGDQIEPKLSKHGLAKFGKMKEVRQILRNPQKSLALPTSLHRAKT